MGSLGQRLKLAFSKVDPEGNGLISKSSLCKVILEHSVVLGADLDESSVTNLFKHCGCESNDGMIKYLEFIDAICSEAPNHSSLRTSTMTQSDAASIDAQSEAAYKKVETKLGGCEAIHAFRDISQKLQAKVKRRLGERSPWRHDVIIHHLGLDGLIDVGKTRIKPQFDALVQSLADKFGAEAILPEVKGPDRSRVKVSVRYGGDASQLSDIVRATLKFKMSPRVVADMYAAVDALVNMSNLHGARVQVTHFADRFQSPMKGGYRDLLCLIKINGYTCELQLNIDEILTIKESLGHHQYELTRKTNDDLIHAAMKGNYKGLMHALYGKGDPNASRDMYNLSPLHYAAQHGSVEMVEALVSQGADVFAQDQDGRFPIFRGILLGHSDVVDFLLAAMESTSEFELQGELDGDMAAAALETTPLGNILAPEVIAKIVRFESRHVPPARTSLLHCWVSDDRSEAFTAAAQMGLLDVLGGADEKNQAGSTPFDVAIIMDAIGMAEALLIAGCRPTKIYLIENCSSELKELLAKYCSGDPFARSLASISNKDPFQAGRDGDLVSIEVFALNEFNFLTQDDEQKTVMQRAAQGKHYDVLRFLDTVVPGSQFAGVKSICSNGDAVAILKENGSVAVWGPEELGGNANMVKDQLKSGVQSLHCTGHSMMIGAFAALKADGSVVCWGVLDIEAWGNPDIKILPDEIKEQLAADVVSLQSTALTFAALKADGSVLTWGTDEAKDLVELEGGVQSLHSCIACFAALKDDGSVFVWPKQHAPTAAPDIHKRLSDGVSAIFMKGPFEDRSRLTMQDLGLIDEELKKITVAAVKTDASVILWGKPIYKSEALAMALDFLGADPGEVLIIDGTEDVITYTKGGVPWEEPDEEQEEAVQGGGDDGEAVIPIPADDADGDGNTLSN